MPKTALSDLLGRRVRFEAHEAVALARQLLENPCGIPTPENIQIRSDGSASCISTDGTPSVSNVAYLLLTLLPDGTPNVPAPLRYAIARGLDAVEAPPFRSLDEFSSALARFEKGLSGDVLRGVLRRGAFPAHPIAMLPAPVTQLAAARAPVAAQPTVVPSRPTLVVRKPPTSSSGSSQPPAPQPKFDAVGVDREAGSQVQSSRGWVLAAAAALVASFAVGFAIVGGITSRRAATEPSGSAPGPAEVSAATPAAKPSVANRAEIATTDEIVGAPRTPAVGRSIAPPPAPARAGVSADAVQAVRATHADAFSPAFASDGTAIFFHTGRERNAPSAIEVTTGSSQTGRDFGIMTLVDDGSHNSHAQPSPDGRFVAFDSDRDGERGVYVANRDGSQVRRVSGAGYAAVPRWSRNSESLAYIRAEANKPTVWNLWVQPAAGGTARRVTNYRYGQTWAASWFPDDRRIAYSHEDTLLVMDLQTAEVTRYLTPVKGRLVRTPAVSPDGTKIVFQVFRDGVWLLDLTDGSMRRLLTDPTAEEFAWSPDGRRIAFHSRRDGQWGIYVLLRS